MKKLLFILVFVIIPTSIVLSRTNEDYSYLEIRGKKVFNIDVIVDTIDVFYGEDSTVVEYVVKKTFKKFLEAMLIGDSTIIAENLTIVDYVKAKASKKPVRLSRTRKSAEISFPFVIQCMEHVDIYLDNNHVCVESNYLWFRLVVLMFLALCAFLYIFYFYNVEFFLLRRRSYIKYTIIIYVVALSIFPGWNFAGLAIFVFIYCFLPGILFLWFYNKKYKKMKKILCLKHGGHVRIGNRLNRAVFLYNVFDEKNKIILRGLFDMKNMKIL